MTTEEEMKGAVERLEPCPCCRGSATVEHDYHEDNDRAPRDFWWVRVCCDACDLRQAWSRYGKQEQRKVPADIKAAAVAEAITAWNTRASTTPTRSQGEAPESGLISRKAVINGLTRMANEIADMALTGESEQARLREAQEAGITRAKYMVAFLPTVQPAEGGDGLLEALKGLSEVVVANCCTRLKAPPSADIELGLALDRARAAIAKASRPSTEGAMDEAAVRTLVQDACTEAGSVAKWARLQGLCDEQVGLFLRNKRPAEPALLKVLGLERVVTYRPSTEAGGEHGGQ